MINLTLRSATVKRRMEENQQRVENTIVQVKAKDGTWMDYSRDTEAVVTAWLEMSAPRDKEWRAVDWLTREELFEPKQ